MDANRRVKKHTVLCVAQLEANSKGHRLLTACTLTHANRGFRLDSSAWNLSSCSMITSTLRLHLARSSFHEGLHSTEAFLQVVNKHVLSGSCVSGVSLPGPPAPERRSGLTRVEHSDSHLLRPAQDPAVNCGFSEHSSSTVLTCPPPSSPLLPAPFLSPEEISVSSMKYNLTSTRPPPLCVLPRPQHLM